MKSKIIRCIILAVVIFAFIALICCAVAGFVFLAPALYPDNSDLSDQENYFIKKQSLELVEDRFSAFSDNKDENNPHRVFVFIDHNFMDSVTRYNGRYIVRIKTYGMVPMSDDAVMEITFSDDLSVVSYGLDP